MEEALRFNKDHGGVYGWGTEGISQIGVLFETKAHSFLRKWFDSGYTLAYTETSYNVIATKFCEHA